MQNFKSLSILIQNLIDYLLEFIQNLIVTICFWQTLPNQTDLFELISCLKLVLVFITTTLHINLVKVKSIIDQGFLLAQKFFPHHFNFESKQLNQKVNLHNLWNSNLLNPQNLLLSQIKKQNFKIPMLMPAPKILHHQIRDMILTNSIEMAAVRQKVPMVS